MIHFHPPLSFPDYIHIFIEQELYHKQCVIATPATVIESLVHVQ